ncbi:MAG: nucleotidyl transferase AbiEii/AbiGii toxin family protein [Thermodesulfobacteriota bacterium]
MDIEKQFKILTEFFEAQHFDYALIGAYALYAYGYTRATRDVDFITRLEYQDKIVQYLESLGFETLNVSEGFSNHLLSVGSVRVDLVYVSDETADIIFHSVKKMGVFQDINLPVVSGEHLLALKLFAIQNDPHRKFKELADIKELLRLIDLDKETIRNYFKKYQLENYYNEIVEQQK